MQKENSSLHAIREELEEMIEQVRHEVEKKDQDITEIKRRQDNSFDLLFCKMERLKDDLKALSMSIHILESK